jgi:2-iminobutanoate/2-iminopropanoate deaminase
MIGLDVKSGTLVEGGPGVETAKILENLENALSDFGLTWNDLFGATLYTTRFDDFAEINKAWEQEFHEDNPPPARTAVGVSALPLGASVEIEFRFFRE